VCVCVCVWTQSATSQINSPKVTCLESASPRV
jgi:hypothetical protein